MTGRGVAGWLAVAMIVVGSLPVMLATGAVLGASVVVLFVWLWWEFAIEIVRGGDTLQEYKTVLMKVEEQVPRVADPSTARPAIGPTETFH